MTQAFSQRNLAIDMLRALTMALMVFVNHLWTVGGIPHWMLHSQTMEDFMGLSDIVFPTFLFVVGLSIPYAIESRFRKGFSAESTLWHILTRTFALLVMGVFTVNSGSAATHKWWFSILMVVGFFLTWNDYPREGRQGLWKALKVLGCLLLLGLAVWYRKPDGGVMSASWWGILGLIGWSYLFCALTYLLCRDRLPLLGLVWGCLVFVCLVSTVTRSGAPLFDFPRPNVWDQFRDLLHIGNGSSAIMTMGGVITAVALVRHAARWTPRQRLLGALSAALILTGFGFASHVLFITSKNIGTLPWVLWVTALDILLYAGLSWMARKGLTGWFRWFKPAGTATLTVYMIPYLTYAFSEMTGISLWHRFNGLAGVLYCACYAALCIFLTWCLGRMRIKLKI